MVRERRVVLASGGADSATLVADQAGLGLQIQPLYIRFGLGWEGVEEAHLRRFLAALPDRDGIEDLVVLELPVGDVYGAHWSVSGLGSPDASTEDDAVYLPGRNMLLLVKTAVWCALHGVGSIALGTLRGNPFADSSQTFLSGFAGLSGLALGCALDVVTPFSGLSKAEVLVLGRDLPLEHTFSCISPEGSDHCGRCNKCAERRKAFAEADLEDRTPYAAD
jgi:7-cyano-7-deazaguanine synthase